MVAVRKMKNQTIVVVIMNRSRSIMVVFVCVSAIGFFGTGVPGVLNNRPCWTGKK